MLRALPVCMLLLLVAMHATAQPVEEFQAHGPMDFHNKAMDTFLAMRKANPDVNLSHDGEFLQRASKHAVKRLLRKPDEMFERTVCGACCMPSNLGIVIQSVRILYFHSTVGKFIGILTFTSYCPCLY